MNPERAIENNQFAGTILSWLGAPGALDSGSYTVPWNWEPAKFAEACRMGAAALAEVAALRAENAILKMSYCSLVKELARMCLAGDAVLERLGVPRESATEPKVSDAGEKP